jgi:cyclopropane fatty-acyl-phospholipid synthase-like methyltransferase
MSEAAVEAALVALPLRSQPRMLDTGCGSGEMLLRALRLHRGARGLGVDLDADAIADARQRAVDLPAEFEGPRRGDGRRRLRRGHQRRLVARSRRLPRRT